MFSKRPKKDRSYRAIIAGLARSASIPFKFQDLELSKLLNFDPTSCLGLTWGRPGHDGPVVDSRKSRRALGDFFFTTTGADASGVQHR